MQEIKNTIRTYFVEDEWYVDIEYSAEDEIYLCWLYDIDIGIKMLACAAAEYQDGYRVTLDDVVHDMEELLQDDEMDPRFDYVYTFRDQYCDGDCENCAWDDDRDSLKDDDYCGPYTGVHNTLDNVPNSERILQFNKDGKPKIIF